MFVGPLGTHKPSRHFAPLADRGADMEGATADFFLSFLPTRSVPRAVSVVARLSSQLFPPSFRWTFAGVFYFASPYRNLDFPTAHSQLEVVTLLRAIVPLCTDRRPGFPLFFLWIEPPSV